jgi:hypothetical protein
MDERLIAAIAAQNLPLMEKLLTGANPNVKAGDRVGLLNCWQRRVW